MLVGEMRDLATTLLALTAAETGHLVLSTLHTLDATETINRVIGQFPTHQQMQARLTLSAVLRGVISQRLLPRADGKGMVPALEVMVNTERVREMIEDQHRTREIGDAIAEGKHPYGMSSFDQSLAVLVQGKLVTYEVAVKNSSSPSDFALLFRGVSGGGSGADEAGWSSEIDPTGTGRHQAAAAADSYSGDLEIERFQK